jgi:predicted acylesterase/phospholipase RssA
MSATPKPLSVYTLPVSGTAFTRQLAFLCLLSKAVKLSPSDKSFARPDIVLGSSGGNISAYIAFAADWDHNNISEIINLFDSETFLTSWDYYLIPDWIYFLMSRTLFSPGYGFEGIFKLWFSGRSARDGAEIWTGTVDKSTHRHQLFTNKAEGYTVLRPRLIGTNASGPVLAEAPEAIYLDGDLTAISEVTRASASIPFLVKPVSFNGIQYSDGGGIYASPLSSFSENLLTIGRAPPPNDRIMRMFFFSSSNVEHNPTSSVSISSDLKDLINGNINQELRIFLNLLQSFDVPNIRNPVKYSNVTPEMLKDILVDLNAKNTHYGIVFFPDNGPAEQEAETVNFFHKIRPHEIHLDIVKTLAATSLYVWN